VIWGTVACVVSLALCALSGNFIVLSFARLLAGFAAAAGFVGGGALAATIAANTAGAREFPAQPVLCRTGHRHPGLRIDRALRAAGLRSRLVVDRVVGVDRALACLLAPLVLAPLDGKDEFDSTVSVKFSVGPVLIYLTAYFLFGAGYIAYMTFMIAYVRDGGGGASAQATFWSLIGVSAFRHALGLAAGAGAQRGGAGDHHHPRHQRDRRGTADLRPFADTARDLRTGVRRAFFAVVGSTTAFVRLNYPPAEWPAWHRAMTIAFGIGQTLGPDRGRRHHGCGRQSLLALNVSAALLALGALLSAFQRNCRDQLPLNELYPWSSQKPPL
jgi:hypothetical protein